MEKKYPKVVETAKAQAEEFEVINEGIFLTEEHLANLEAAFVNSEKALATLNTSLETATENVASLKETITANAETISKKDAEITSLKVELEEAKKKPAGTFEEKEKESDVLPAPTVHSLAPSIERRIDRVLGID